ncbi:MAG: DRTGG domain-containing protein [Oscillospiraceae bacterium]
MTVKQLLERIDVRPLALPEPDCEITGGYAGDLLSWVMGNAGRGCVWMTVMTNRSTIAVASLLEMACIIVTEGSDVPEEVAELAVEKGINLVSTDVPTYEMCAQIAQLL